LLWGIFLIGILRCLRMVFVFLLVFGFFVGVVNGGLIVYFGVFVFVGMLGMMFIVWFFELVFFYGCEV